MFTYSVIQKSQLEGASRIDAEYYQPEYLRIGKLLTNAKTISEIATTFDLQSNGAFAQIFNILNDNNEKNIPYIIGNILGLRTVLAFCAVILASVTVFLLPKWNNTYIPLGVTIAGIGTFLTIISGTIASVLQVHFKMQYDTLGQVLGRIVSVGYMLYVIFVAYKNNLDQGFYHIMLAGVLASLIMVINNYYFTIICNIQQVIWG